MQLLCEDKDIEYYQWIITDRKARLLTLTLKICFSRIIIIYVHFIKRELIFRIYTFGTKTNLFLMYRYKNRGHYLSQTMPSPNQLKVITSYICVNIFSTYHGYYFKPQGSKCGNF